MDSNLKLNSNPLLKLVKVTKIFMFCFLLKLFLKDKQSNLFLFLTPLNIDYTHIVFLLQMLVRNLISRSIWPALRLERRFLASEPVKPQADVKDDGVDPIQVCYMTSLIAVSHNIIWDFYVFVWNNTMPAGLLQHPT